MYDKKEHTHRSDEVAHQILVAFEIGHGARGKTLGMSRAWRIVTGSQPVAKGAPTPALKAAATRHRNRYGIDTPAPLPENHPHAKHARRMKEKASG